MKYTRESILLAGLLIFFACSSQPDPQMAELQRYYAQKGEGISPAVKKIQKKSSTRQGTMPYLSTTNLPVPMSTTNVPVPTSTTNSPTPRN